METKLLNRFNQKFELIVLHELCNIIEYLFMLLKNLRLQKKGWACSQDHFFV